MENFTAYNPTYLHFGKNVTEKLGETVQLFGKKVLLIYGKGSIRKNGIYDRVIDQLNSANSEVTEYSGIKPNPIIGDVEKATALGIEKNVEVILAVGGGSVVDSAKVISVCIAEHCDPWQVMKGKYKPTTAIPLIAVLTLAATGTEMNPYAVVQNPLTKEKIGFGHSLMYPKHSFLDPAFTLSVPRDYTVYGIVDLVAHCLEAFFGEGDASLSDRFVAAIIKEAMQYGPLLLNDLQNYPFREKIMWAATTALNGWNSYGRKSGDWGVHDIGHTLSFLYDTPHGATLSVAYPAWLKLQKNRIPDRITELGSYLFNETNIDKIIQQLEDFFVSLSSPVRLNDIGILNSEKEEIIALMTQNQITGFHHKLEVDDYKSLVDYML